jgi:peptidoglycan/xylan/chitin deacetylase (PgdA/CDA1 family)
MDILDVLDVYACPAIFFVSTACLDSDRPLWFMNRDVCPYAPKVAQSLRGLPRREFLMQVKQCGLVEPDPFRGRFGLTSKELQEMVARGHEIGIHTHNHPFLGSWQSDDIRIEIEESHRRVQSALGARQHPLHFAYPSGEFSNEVVQVLRELKADSAVTTNPGSVTPGASIYELPRCVVADADYACWGIWKMTPPHRQLRRLLGKEGSDGQDFRNATK